MGPLTFSGATGTPSSLQICNGRCSILYSPSCVLSRKRKSSKYCKMCAIPCFLMIHSKASAVALNTFGADCSQNGNTESMYTIPDHSMPSSHLSAGCNCVYGTNSRIALTASSTDVYISATTELDQCHHLHFPLLGRTNQ